MGAGMLASFSRQQEINHACTKLHEVISFLAGNGHWKKLSGVSRLIITDK
jgi:hypothetical protein